MELRPDGLLGWSYAEPESLLRDGFRLDSVHTWAVADGALDIRWNLGSARSRYRPSGADGVLASGSSTFCPSPTLVRLR